MGWMRSQRRGDAQHGDSARQRQRVGRPAGVQPAGDALGPGELELQPLLEATSKANPCWSDKGQEEGQAAQKHKCSGPEGPFQDGEPTRACRPAHMHSDRHTRPPDMHTRAPTLRCQTPGLTRIFCHRLSLPPGGSQDRKHPDSLGAGLDRGHLLLKAKCLRS